MSEEIAMAAADLATVEALRKRILEWEDCYDRLAGAFELAKDENARLRSDVFGLRTALEQQQRATEAERDARSRYAIIVLAARRFVGDPIHTNQIRLAAAVAADDDVTEATDVQERARLFNTLLSEGKEGSE